MTLFLATMVGCGPTALQIQAEIAYYEAQAAIMNNQIKSPVFTLVATDATKPIILENVAKIEVYGQSSESLKPIPQYAHKDYSEPFWRWMGIAAMVAAPVVASSTALHEAGKLIGGGSTYYNNNVGQGATGNFRVQGNTSATSSGGGAATATGMTDATSTPTVVEPSVHIMEPSVYTIPATP